MPKWVPFTIHVEITPDRGTGKRQEIWRNMQKIAIDIYNVLTNIDEIHIATPGGGQHTTNSNFSGMAAGMAVKPQIGQAPSQVMITGFYNSQTPNLQPHPEKQLIATNETWAGPGATPHLNNPQATINDEVLILKNLIENAITTNLPNLEYEIFRLEYSGVVYGDKGYHFPI